jgi:hypothetical protein
MAAFISNERSGYHPVSSILNSNTVCTASFKNLVVDGSPSLALVSTFSWPERCRCGGGLISSVRYYDILEFPKCPSHGASS